MLLQSNFTSNSEMGLIPLNIEQLLCLMFIELLKVIY